MNRFAQSRRSVLSHEEKLAAYEEVYPLLVDRVLDGQCVKCDAINEARELGAMHWHKISDGTKTDVFARFREGGWGPNFIGRYLRNFALLCSKCSADFKPKPMRIKLSSRLGALRVRMQTSRTAEEKRHWWRIHEATRLAWVKTGSERVALDEFIPWELAKQQEPPTKPEDDFDDDDVL